MIIYYYYYYVCIAFVIHVLIFLQNKNIVYILLEFHFMAYTILHFLFHVCPQFFKRYFSPKVQGFLVLMKFEQQLHLKNQLLIGLRCARKMIYII